MALRNHQNRISRFTLTLNNWTPEEYELFKNKMQEHCTWAIIGKEVGAEGTPHLQAAGCLRKQTAFSTVRSLFPRSHIESMRGTPQSNYDYCTKEDPSAWEFGSFPQPGKRTDLEDVAACVTEGANLRSLAHTHPVAVIKYSRGLSVLRSHCVEQRTPDKPPSVYWLYGPTGTGKTRAAWDYGCSTFGQDETVILPDSTLQWFDGYDGQKCVIIDDFRSKKVNFAFLLRVLDRYPLTCPIKGGYVNWTPCTIIITTPLDTSDTFQHRQQYIPEDITQLNRRITRRIKFPMGNGEQLGSIVPEQTPDGSNRSRDSRTRQNALRTLGRTESVRSVLVNPKPMYQCSCCYGIVTEVNSRHMCKECRSSE